MKSMATMARSTRTKKRAAKKSKPAPKRAPVKHAKARTGKAGPVKKSPAKPVAAAKPKPKAAAVKIKPAPVPKTAKPKSAAVDPAHIKRLAQIFGPLIARAAIEFSAEHAAELAGVQNGLCVLHFSPRPDRMSWASMTHGLSATGSKQSPRPEFLVQFRQRDVKAPQRLLTDAARYALSLEGAINGCELVAAGDEQGFESGINTLPHWLICMPDKTVAEPLAALQPAPRVALLVGITEGELQSALRVPSELADGRKVLLEALRVGQVYPVSDADRLCMTRRRDFHRVWETAFQLVRGAKA